MDNGFTIVEGPDGFIQKLVDNQLPTDKLVGVSPIMIANAKSFLDGMNQKAMSSDGVSFVSVKGDVFGKPN